jgi:probable O-glycosylation ligase (exosortase A-associated)
MRPSSKSCAPDVVHETALNVREKPRGLGLAFFLLLLYPVFDYGRPPNPMGIPMVISILLAAAWLFTPTKKVNLQIVCFLLLLAGMAIGTVGAVNYGSAYFADSAMAIILLCICIPLIHIVDSLRKVKIFVNVLVAVFLYVGLWMLISGGMGPAGARGAQDQNYASAMMCMAIPLAYFSMPLTSRHTVKLFYVVALAIFAAAVVISGSRGGFVGLVAVALFCVLYSPKRKQALTILSVSAFVVLVVAGPAYWEEMKTIPDTTESTADIRLELWTIAARMFVHNPVFGVGPGNFRWNVGTYQSVEQLEKFGRDLTYSVYVHSTYFEILSELGLVGAVLFATILVRTFRDLKRIRTCPSRDPGEAQQFRYFSLAIAGCLVGYLVPAAFISFTYFSHVWLVIALAVALNEIAKFPAGSPRGPVTRATGAR